MKINSITDDNECTFYASDDAYFFLVCSDTKAWGKVVNVDMISWELELKVYALLDAYVQTSTFFSLRWQVEVMILPGLVAFKRTTVVCYNWLLFPAWEFFKEELQLIKSFHEDVSIKICKKWTFWSFGLPLCVYLNVKLLWRLSGI